MLHINDLIAAGAEEPDIEQDAESFLEEDLGKDSNTMVDAVLILGQLDPLETGRDGRPRWTTGQQTLIMEAVGKLTYWQSRD